MMSFRIKVKNTIFEWKNKKLHCDDDQTLKELKEHLELHIPTVVVMPDEIDYDDDLTNGSNAYYAIIGEFKEAKVLVEPDEEFLHPDYEPGRIY